MKWEFWMAVAFRLGFHMMSQHDMASKGREMIAALPHPRFDGLEPGKTYLTRHGIGACGRDVVFRVVSVTPKRTQAVVTHPPLYDKTYRLNAGDYNVAEITEMDADMLAFVGKTHADVVAAAKAAGLYDGGAPMAVKVKYPHLFVEVPERFAKGERETAAQRLQHTLDRPGWGRREYLTAEDVMAFVEQAHKHIKALTCQRNQAKALDSSVAGDYDRIMAEHMGDVEFYRWLLPHVSEGGVFCPPPSEREAPDVRGD